MKKLENIFGFIIWCIITSFRYYVQPSTHAENAPCKYRIGQGRNFTWSQNCTTQWKEYWSPVVHPSRALQLGRLAIIFWVMCIAQFSNLNSNLQKRYKAFSLVGWGNLKTGTESIKYSKSSAEIPQQWGLRKYLDYIFTVKSFISQRFLTLCATSRIITHCWWTRTMRRTLIQSQSWWKPRSQGYSAMNSYSTEWKPFDKNMPFF